MSSGKKISDSFAVRLFSTSLMLISVLLFSADRLEALDPSKKITQYVLDVWTSDNGLPQNTVTSIVQTKDGYLWIGTSEGLVRFDGVRFTVFDKKNTPAFQNFDVVALLEDHQGSLWIGTNRGGLYRFKNGIFTHVISSNDSVVVLHEDRRKNLWIGTSGGGLKRFSNGKFTNYTTQNGLSNNYVTSIYEDHKGNLWVGTFGGLTQIKDERFTVFNTADGLSDNFVWCISETQGGNLWIGTKNGGLNSLKDGKFTSYQTENGLSSNNVRVMYEDHHKNLWIGTDGGGINRLTQDRFTSLRTTQGLSNDFIYSFLEDREGSLWIGTNGGGLNRLKDGKLTTLGVNEGLSNDLATSITQDIDGTLWIGTDGGGLNQLKDGKVITYTTQNGLSSDRVRSLYLDSQRNVWIGTNGGGLNQLKNNQITIYRARDGLANDYVHSIFQDREKSLWIGTGGGGLNRIKNGKITKYTTGQGFLNDFVWFLFEDRSADLWIGTSGGLSKFYKEKFSNYTKGGLSKYAVFFIHEDHDGVLWIGSYGGGLIRLKGNELTTFTTRNGLYDDRLFTILEDDRENLWMSCNKGIFSVSKKELNSFTEGKTKSIHSVSYDKTDGMKSQECYGGSQPAGYRSMDGKLWFATIKGVVMVDPQNMKKNLLRPPVHIVEMIAGNQRINPLLATGDMLRLSPGNEKLEFHYTALSFLNPEKVEFKYKLEGFDKNWVEAGSRRIAYYTNIAPGQYKFRVIASNDDGVWNDVGAAFDFYLDPFFYQTRWFYALCVLAAILVAVAAHRIRVRRVRERFSVILNERTRISRELHDTLAQSLLGVAIQLDAADGIFSKDPDRSRYHVLRARDLARESAEEARRAVWELRHESLAVDDIVNAIRQIAGQLPNLNGACVDVKAIGKLRKLSADTREQLLRIAQEAMTNAAKHAEAKLIEVRMHYESRSVELRIQDNGRGFDLADAPDIYQGHFGLTGIRERAQELGGRMTIKSKPGQGTLISIRLPK